MSIANCPGFIYTVKKGDTMFQLARRYGITLEELIAANPQVPDPNRLTIGQQLCIPREGPGPGPVPPPPPPCEGGTIYTVRQGDTLFLIARRNNLALATLIAANPQITNPDVLEIGQRICIPAGPVVPPPPEPPACEGGFIYTIRQGDTIFSLARVFNVTVAAILAANPGIDPEMLRVGQRICIPFPVPETCTGQLYTVRQGDTLGSIAAAFGVDLAALIAANPQIADPNRIFPGQVICIPREMPVECPNGIIHMVRAGETIFTIAGFYGTTVQAIINANPGIDPQNLRVGQRICVPLPAPPTCTGQLYTVRAGDSLFSIAQAFGLTVAALLAANPQITDPSRIFPGQIICIPKDTPMECVGGTMHVVRAGDTLFNLANYYGSTVQAIIAANPGIDPQNLPIGRSICIPLPRPVRCAGQLYTVKPGESLYSIATMFKVPYRTLVAANPQIADPNRIFPGQIICVPQPCPPMDPDDPMGPCAEEK